MAKRRKVGTITEVLVDLSCYTYLMNGVGGIGKTTTVCELGQREFGQDGYLLLTVGEEPKPVHIGGLWNDRAMDWDELEEIIETLVEYKDEDYPNLKMVGVDSVDEVFRLAENKVIELHNKKVPNVADKIDTIKKAFGGYQAGENKVIDMVTELLFRLRNVGVSLFFIGHTKTKNKADQVSDIEFEQITSNLDSKYYNCIKDKVNIVMCAYMEREFVDLQTRKDAFTKTNKTVGAIKSEKAMVAFRDDEHAIDTKSHLKYIVPKCELDAKTIITELKEAMKKQTGLYGAELSSEEMEVKAKAQQEAVKVEAEKTKAPAEPEVDEATVKAEKVEYIKNNLSKLDMGQLQGIMGTYSITNFNDPSAIKMEALDEIVALIK